MKMSHRERTSGNPENEKVLWKEVGTYTAILILSL